MIYVLAGFINNPVVMGYENTRFIHFYGRLAVDQGLFHTHRLHRFFQVQTASTASVTINQER